MPRTSVPSFAVAVVLAAGFLTVVPASRAAAADTPEQRCRKYIESGLFSATSRILKARRQCQENVILGRASASASCATGSPSVDIARALADANTSLRSRLQTACAGVSWGLLSYPGSCPSTAPGVFDADQLVDCILTSQGRIIRDLFEIWYPAHAYGQFGSAAGCERSIPKRASAMLLRELRLRLECLLDEEIDPRSNDCRALLPPHGAGTGSLDLDDDLARAQYFRMPSACWKTDFLSLGYGDDCPSIVAGSGLVDLQRCVREAHRTAIPLLLDLAFPQGIVCGNGIPQEGEECDAGASNSNTTPNACRLDCTLPVCGDHVTDPARGETCDDGNSTNLDGCTAGCKAEVCGDGTTNNLPNETCDDGNTNGQDTCTNSCHAAMCGDGIVCSDPACTTGPSGGPEQCDKGAANSEAGLCKPDCSGFARSCTLTVGVTNAVELGALTYRLSYRDAAGEMVGTGGKVDCKSTVTGGLVSFFDNDASRFVKESLIVDAGLPTPATLATCTFATNAASLPSSDFAFTIEVAADPDFNTVPATLAVTSIACN